MRNPHPKANVSAESEVVIYGPEVEMGAPPKVPERLYTLLAQGLMSHPDAKKFVVWSGAPGATTQLVYNRQRQTLTSSFYLLSEDFHSHRQNVSAKNIAAVAKAEEKGNKVWWEKDNLHEVRIEPDSMLKKHGARIVKRKQNQNL